jgi:hypothetical protein
MMGDRDDSTPSRNVRCLLDGRQTFSDFFSVVEPRNEIRVDSFGADRSDRSRRPLPAKCDRWILRSYATGDR